MPGDKRFDDAYYCREAAIDALAQYWPLAVETVACLRSVAQADPVDWMRELALDWLERLSQSTAM